MENKTKKEKKKMKPLKKEYNNNDELIEEFCKRKKCKACYGKDENGEPNGYGCKPMEKFIDDNNLLIKNWTY